MKLSIVRLDPDLAMPSIAHEGDAGLDLIAREDVELDAGGGRATVPTGIAVAIQPGYVGLVAPRSGLAAAHGVTVLNGPGVIDGGYRGEVVVVLINLDANNRYYVNRGDRIAQLLLVRIASIELTETTNLPPTARGTSGLGRSGR